MNDRARKFVLKHDWIHTYCIVGREHFGLWFRLAHWCNFWWYERKPFLLAFQIGPLNVRFGRSPY